MDIAQVPVHIHRPPFTHQPRSWLEVPHPLAAGLASASRELDWWRSLAGEEAELPTPCCCLLLGLVYTLRSGGHHAHPPERTPEPIRWSHHARERASERLAWRGPADARSTGARDSNRNESDRRIGPLHYSRQESPQAAAQTSNPGTRLNPKVSRSAPPPPPPAPALLSSRRIARRVGLGLGSVSVSYRSGVPLPYTALACAGSLPIWLPESFRLLLLVVSCVCGGGVPRFAAPYRSPLEFGMFVTS